MDTKRICYNCMKSTTNVQGYCSSCGFLNFEYSYTEDQIPPLTLLNGKYIIGRNLATGGFGNTYIALDTHLNTKVAIKELFLTNICHRDADNGITVSSSGQTFYQINKKRFAEEARVLAMFNEFENEGIVLVKDYFEENNTSYIVMEYLSGETLKTRVERRTMTMEAVRSLFEPICHALTKIHQFNIVHLDVSPENIMVLNDGRAKLLDFGTAKQIGYKRDSDIITFKRGYASPEQYSETGRIGQWSDVYGLAATIYYCITGVRPPDAIDRIAHQKLENPSKYANTISNDEELVLLRALDLDPTKRFQTVEDFWEGLNNRKKKKPIAQKPPHETASQAKNNKKKRTKGVSIAYLLAGLLSTLAACTAIYFLLIGSPSKIISSDSEAEASTEKKLEIGDNLVLDEGAYIFESAGNRSMILGIEGGYGDDHTPLVLKDYSDLNENRIIVTEQDKGYYLQMAHDKSYLEAADSQKKGSGIDQIEKGTEASSLPEWTFIYCGHDDEKDMDEVIIKSPSGYAMVPENDSLTAGTKIILDEYDIDKDLQKWYVRWSERDENEALVPVYHEKDLVNNIEGKYNIISVYDGKTSINLNHDTNYHPEPTLVVFYAEWLTQANKDFLFEFVPTGSESRYKIYPVDKNSKHNKCLEFNPDTKEIVMRKESDNKNQLFRIVYVKNNIYLLQTYNESVLGFDPDENGKAIGQAVLSRPYKELKKNSSLQSWQLVMPPQ